MSTERVSMAQRAPPRRSATISRFRHRLCGVGCEIHFRPTAAAGRPLDFTDSNWIHYEFDWSN